MKLEIQEVYGSVRKSIPNENETIYDNIEFKENNLIYAIRNFKISKREDCWIADMEYSTNNGLKLFYFKLPLKMTE